MRTLALTVTAAFCLQASAQISTGGQPYTLRAGLSLQDVPTVRSTSVDAAAVAAEDALWEAQGKVPAYSRILPVGAGLQNAGEWMGLPGGDRLWRLRVATPGALANELYFTDFHLPENASLYVYSEDGESILGGFTAYNNSEDGVFTTSLLPGEACVVEYYEPAAVSGEGSLLVRGVGHAYRFVEEVSRAAGACEVDVNCSEGDDWYRQRDAVVRISIVEGNAGYWCSGALVNNLAEDCKPYFLTAQHCYEGNSQSEMNQWKFYFNYERAGCATGTAPSNRTMTGCFKRGASDDGGGASGSDFLLVEGKTDVPASYRPFWAGWDATGVGSTGGVGIHHPAGDRKKISTFTMATQQASWQGPYGTHWRVGWVATTNGHGVTEGGSSGSPLFNSTRRVIGTLTGGSSYCDTPGGWDYYGKMSYHWQSNPSTAALRLKNFLDPNGTGTKKMDGSYNPCGLYSGIQERDATEPLVLYPNPAHEQTVVQLPGRVINGLLEVFDMGGRLVHTQAVEGSGEASLNTVALENGAYVLRLQADGRMVASSPLMVLHP